jgi:protocatechuate 3,4-dioxygenase beta subunit
MINKMPNRGGAGVVKPYKLDGMLHVERDIILGKNIPDYN